MRSERIDLAYKYVWTRDMLIKGVPKLESSG